jgi:hydrogenase maturation protease
VIGVGNEYRHDDAAGLITARRIKQHVSQDWEVHEQIGEGSALMELWQDCASVILVDAVQSGSASGKVCIFDASFQALPAKFSLGSTHAFGVMQAIELSRTLGRLPRQFLFYGIEGENFEPGIGISPGVQAGIDYAIELISQKMAASAEPAGQPSIVS